MRRSLLIVCISILIILVCGCTTNNMGPQTQNEINGYVYYNGYTLSNAHVEAESVDGTDIISTTTDGHGAYTLKIKPDTTYNVTATRDGLRHTVWPVSIGDKHYEYNISLTATPRSYIEGTGSSSGGPLGYDNSQPLTGFTFNVTQVNGNSTLTTAIQNDWSYSVEVEPDIRYKIERYMPDVYFHYRNNDDVVSNVSVGPNETALIDYVVFLP